MNKFIDIEALKAVFERISLDLIESGLTEDSAKLYMKDIRGLNLNRSFIMFDEFEKILLDRIKGISNSKVVKPIMRHGFEVDINRMSAKTFFSIVETRYEKHIEKLYEFNFEYSDNILNLAINDCDDKIYTKQDVLPVVSKYLHINRNFINNKKPILDKIDNSIEPFDIDKVRF